MTLTDLDTKNLRKIAEGATQGEWRLQDDTDYWEVLGEDSMAIVAGSDQGVTTDIEDARHIATFDPPTVLRLLDALEMRIRLTDARAEQIIAIESERDEARQEVERLLGLLGDDRAHPTEWR